MICKECAREADEQRSFVDMWGEVPADLVPMAMAPGSGIHRGHRDCQGCDCQHRPVKPGGGDARS